MLNGLYSSESVSKGHPDKVCDQISDKILDYCLDRDPNARVACEVLIKCNTVVIAGEISSSKKLQLEENLKVLTLDCLRGIGYDREEYGFLLNKAKIINLITEQSDEIALGVNKDGAGDQGSMVGYATDEHESYLPLPFALCQKMMIEHSKRLTQSPNLLADAKCQVTMMYHKGVAESIHTLVFSAQHQEQASQEQVEDELNSIIRLAVSDDTLLNSQTRIFINPTGSFVKGGPLTDTGLTGRKLLVDTYGSTVRHGGGAFSGKDPTKVDRSGAYLCRYLAKNIVASGIARQCEVQISYCIGMSQPVSIVVDCPDDSQVKQVEIEEAIKQLPFLTPSALIDKLQLRKPIYESTAAFGHFGRNDQNFTWEKLDLVDYFKHYKYGTTT